MKIISLFIIGLFCITLTKGQTNQQFELTLSPMLSFSEAKTTNTEAGMQGMSTYAQGNFYLSDKWSIKPGIGLSKWSGTFTNDTGLASVTKQQFIDIPLLVNYISPTSNGKLVIGGGVIGSYNIKQNIIIGNNNSEETGLGWNIGIAAELAYDHRVSDKMDIGMLLFGKEDVTVNYDHANSEIEHSTMQLGMRFTFRFQ